MTFPVQASSGFSSGHLRCFLSLHTFPNLEIQLYLLVSLPENSAAILQCSEPGGPTRSLTNFGIFHLPGRARMYHCHGFLPTALFVGGLLSVFDRTETTSPFSTWVSFMAVPQGREPWCIIHLIMWAFFFF